MILGTAACSADNSPATGHTSAALAGDAFVQERFLAAAGCTGCRVLTVARLNLPRTARIAASAKIRSDDGTMREVTLLGDGTPSDGPTLIAAERAATPKIDPALGAWVKAALPTDRRWIWVVVGLVQNLPRREDVVRAGGAIVNRDDALTASGKARQPLVDWASARGLQLGEGGGPIVRVLASAKDVTDLAAMAAIVRVGTDEYPGRSESLPWSSTSEWGSTIHVPGATRVVRGFGAKVCIKEDVRPDDYTHLSVVATANPTGPTGSHARASAGLVRNNDVSAWPWVSVAPEASVYVANWLGYSGSGGVDAWCASNGTTTLGYSYSVLGGAAGGLAGTDMQHDWLAKNSPYMLVVASAGAVDTSIANGYFVRNRGYNGLVVGGVDDRNTQATWDDLAAPSSAWGNPTTVHSDYELPHLAAPSNGALAAGATVSGTSAAAAMTAGVAALLDATDSSLQYWPEAKRAIILATAVRRADQGLITSLPLPVDGKIGAGVLDAAGAAALANPKWAADAYGATTVAAAGRLARTVTFASDIGTDGYLTARWKAKATTNGRLRVVLTFDSTAACSGAGGTCTADVPDVDMDLHIVKKTDGSWTPAGAFVCSSSTYDSTWELCDIPVLAGEEYLILVRKYSSAAPATYVGVAWNSYEVGENGPCSRHSDCSSQTCGDGHCFGNNGCTGGASTPAATIAWSNAPSGTVSIAGSAGYIVTNPRATSVSYRVNVAATGLDGRRVRRPLTTGSLAPQASISLSLPLSSVPVRSIGAASDARLEVEILDGGGATASVIRTGPLYYESSPDYSTFTFYGSTGKSYNFDWNNTSDAYWLQSIAAIGVSAVSVNGTYWNGTNFVPPVQNPGSAYANLGQSVVMKGDGPGGDAAPGRPDDLAHAGVPSSPNTWRICSHWVARYADSGNGESYLTNKFENFANAAYARARLVRLSDSVGMWTGTLDSQGCSPYLSLNSYTSYGFTLFPTSTNGGVSTLVQYFKEATPGSSPPPWTPKHINEILFATFSTTSSPSGATLTISPWEADDLTNVAAIQTRMLTMTDNGLLPLATPYRAYVDVRLGGSGGATCLACGGADGLKLGVESTGLNNADYKFVIGHEFGHVVEANMNGLAGTNAKNYPISGAPPDVCKCSHIPDVTLQAHCLQGRMTDTGAHIEGFAHFYGARVLNAGGPSACRFAYYKHVLHPPTAGFTSGIALPGSLSATTNLAPPVVLDCGFSNRWEDSLCSEPASVHSAIENDYMGFFYGANTASSNAVPIADFAAIHKMTCNGRLEVFCGDDSTLHWDDMLTAAAKVYAPGGLLDPRYVTLTNQGVSHGVNH